MTFYGTKHLHFKNRQNCKVSLWILWSYSPRQTSKANLSIQMFSTELGKVLFARSIAFLVFLSFWCCKINLQYAIIDIRSTFVLKPSSSPVFSVHNVNIVCIVQTKQKLKCVPRLLLCIAISFVLSFTTERYHLPWFNRLSEETCRALQTRIDVSHLDQSDETCHSKFPLLRFPYNPDLALPDKLISSVEC